MNIKKEIVPIGSLKPLERVFQHHLENLSSMINGVMNKPLIVDKESGTILDGSHRYVYLYKNGYLEAPAIMVDYLDNRISTGISLTKTQILNRVELLPPRTTRHKFPFIKEDLPTELQSLKKGDCMDASPLIYLSEANEEIFHNLRYLEELNESQAYIEAQLGMLKPKGYFVGKFNPPHIGHAGTILKLKKEYNLTIVVTKDTSVKLPYSPSEIIKELGIFDVPVAYYPNRLIDQNENPFFYEEAFILSGNEEVIEWARKVGAKYRFIERTGIISSTKIRGHE